MTSGQENTDPTEQKAPDSPYTAVDEAFHMLPLPRPGEDPNITIARAAMHLLYMRNPACADSIAYVNGKFADVTTDHNYYPFHSEVTIINTDRFEIANQFEDCERLIIIGGGPGKSLEAKEMKVIDVLLGSGVLKDVVLVETSDDYLQQQEDTLKTKFNGRAFGNNNPPPTITRHHMDFMYPTTEFRDYIKENPVPRTGVISTGSLISQIPVNSTTTFPRERVSSALASLGALGDVLWLGYNSSHKMEDIDRIQKCYGNSGVSKFIENIPGILQRYHYTETDGAALVEGLETGPEFFRHEMHVQEYGKNDILMISHCLRVLQDQTLKLEVLNLRHKLNCFIEQGDTLTAFSSLIFSPEKMKKMGENLHSHHDAADDMNTVFCKSYKGMTDHIFVKKPDPARDEGTSQPPRTERFWDTFAQIFLPQKNNL